MLGIRHCAGVAIDLWVGPKDLFACDGYLSADLQEGHLKSWEDAHLAVQVDQLAEHYSLPDFFQRLRVLLETHAICPRRVSLICTTVEEYQLWAGALRGNFVEDDG
ncbi:MAG: hypothetical protein OXT67_00155 [Zetaproteobacteria bacterium]|nr:hypothetical protein [Zetaproteobacteria bacterium]